MNPRWLFVGTGTGLGVAFGIIGGFADGFGELIGANPRPTLINDLCWFTFRTACGTATAYVTFVVGNLIVTRKLRW